LLKSKARHNNSVLKTDIVINPQLKTRFGDWDNPVRAQLGIVPTIMTSFGRGSSIFAQLIIPFYDDLEPSTKIIRPGIVTINQSIRLPNEIFLSTTIGQFAHVNRYGIDFEHGYGVDLEIKKYFAGGIWSLGANAGYTGDSSYRDEVWKMKTMTRLTYMFSAVYKAPFYNLSIATSLGQFLYGDKGVRIDINRDFGEVQIGFYAIASGKEKNGGFNFSIPIFPSKYYSSPVRVLPPSNFTYEYRVKAFPSDGQLYDTGYKIEHILKRLEPNYIKEFLFR